MDVKKLVLAIMTVDREPQYVHRTLASLFAADPLVHDVSSIHLVIDTDDADYLQDYRHHAKLSFHPLRKAEHDRIGDWSRHRRFSHNYVRCLSLPIPDGGGICVCEDDIVFRDLFVQRLLATVDELEAHTGAADYCLALFTDCDLEQEASFYRGRYFCSYGWAFRGTQCMYYPRGVAEDVRGYLQEHGVDRTDDCGDLLIGKLYGDRMYACPRSLADHIGAVSTGLGGLPPSPTFHRPYVPISPEHWGRCT
jgi:hypothetical protein